jgi:hypothetical protein
MMRKAAVLFCSIFVFSSIAVAGEGIEGKSPKEKNEKSVSIKKEKENHMKELEAFVKKYNSASQEEQISVKNEMAAAVAEYTDKELAYKKERLTKEKAKIVKLEKEITDIETDRESYVNKQVDFYLSKKGQKKFEKKERQKKK